MAPTTEPTTEPATATTGAVALVEAMRFLRDLLAGGPLDARAVIRAAEQAGIATPTLKRAKQLLQVRSTRVGFGRGSVWRWELPPDATEPAEPAEPHEAAMDDLLSTPEAAKRLGVSAWTLRRWIRSGHVQARRVGSTMIVPAREVDRVRALPRPRPGRRPARASTTRVGRFPGVCAACGNAFSASRPNARYCSSRCEQRVYAARYRAKRRQAGVA
jgi:excisionase family DNA binding protein